MGPKNQERVFRPRTWPAGGGGDAPEVARNTTPMDMENSPPMAMGNSPPMPTGNTPPVQLAFTPVPPQPQNAQATPNEASHETSPLDLPRGNMPDDSHRGGGIPTVANSSRGGDQTMVYKGYPSSHHVLDQVLGRGWVSWNPCSFKAIVTHRATCPPSMRGAGPSGPCPSSEPNRVPK